MAAISGTLSEWMRKNPCYSIEGSKPFELGKSYPRRDGKMVKIVALCGSKGYETVQGDDAEAPHLGARYNRAGDRGRCTGTYHDFSDPGNLLPDFEAGVKDAGKGFLIPVSFMGANRPLEERALFSQILTLEHELTDIRYAANTDKDWRAAHKKIFKSGLAEKFFQACEALKFDFTWCDPQSGYAAMVRAYTWAASEFIEDKRPFYHA
jgi:hypothetical protein